jgi:hypothetical protein
MKSDMAWLQPDAHFDADAWSAPVLGIAASLADHDSGWHQHARAQLLYTRQGCTRLTYGDRSLLPPARAWIPVAAPSRADAPGGRLPFVVLRRHPVGPAAPQPAIIGVGPLLQALLEPIAQAPFDHDWQSPRAHHQLALCVLEIAAAPVAPMDLPLPRDPRIARCLAAGRAVAARTGRAGRACGPERAYRRPVDAA